MSLDTFAVQMRLIALMRNANVMNAASKWAPEYRLYDAVPMNITTADGAYGDIANSIETEDDASLSDGVEHIMTLNVWSEYKGFKELRGVTRAIRSAIHHAVFWFGDMNVITWLDSAQFMDAGDGVTRQGVLRIRCVCRT